MEKQPLSRNYILKDMKIATPIIIGALFLLIATSAIIVVILNMEKLQELAGNGIFIPLFGFPSVFGWVGLLLIVVMIGECNAIKRGNFCVFEDVLVEKPVQTFYRSGKTVGHQYEEETLKFQEYYKLTNKHINKTDKTNNVQIGDVCYLIKIAHKSQVTAVYPKSAYQLDGDLARKLTSATITFNSK